MMLVVERLREKVYIDPGESLEKAEKEKEAKETLKVLREIL